MMKPEVGRITVDTKNKLDHHNREITFNGSCELQGFLSLFFLLSYWLKQVYETAFFLYASRFLYSDEVQIGPETVMTTLYTAKKYAVPALEAHCVEFLKKNLRADNAFMLLTQVRSRPICVPSRLEQIQQFH